MIQIGDLVSAQYPGASVVRHGEVVAVNVNAVTIRTTRWIEDGVDWEEFYHLGETIALPRGYHVELLETENDDDEVPL